MARGAPALWGAISGLPLAGLGLYAVYGDQSIPALVGWPLVVLGACLLLCGVYVEHFAPDSLELGEGEEVHAVFEPDQLVAKLKIGAGLVGLLATAVLLFGTKVPYVYPTATLLLGLYGLLSGVVLYWQNTLTTYYVTSERIMSEYRFLSLDRPGFQHEDIKGIRRNQTAFESLTGLGNVAVSSGGGSRNITEIQFRNLGNSATAEKALRQAQKGGPIDVSAPTHPVDAGTRFSAGVGQQFETTVDDGSEVVSGLSAAVGELYAESTSFASGAGIGHLVKALWGCLAATVVVALIELVDLAFGVGASGMLFYIGTALLLFGLFPIPVLVYLSVKKVNENDDLPYELPMTVTYVAVGAFVSVFALSGIDVPFLDTLTILANTAAVWFFLRTLVDQSSLRG